MSDTVQVAWWLDPTRPVNIDQAEYDRNPTAYTLWTAPVQLPESDAVFQASDTPSRGSWEAAPPGPGTDPEEEPTP